MGTTWGQMLADYDRAMRAAGRSPATIRLHRYRLFALAADHPRVERVTTDHLVEILANPTWAAETRKSVRTSFRSFFGWAYKSGRLEHDPAEALPGVRVPPGLPRPTPERVLHAAVIGADARATFMIRLGAYAGLRCSEIARVHSEDWDGRSLRVLGKGGKVRSVVILQPDLVRNLDELSGWAFPNRWTGEPITAGYVTKLLSAALPGDQWTGHTLRHRFATVALAGTGDLLAVGKTLGHSRLDTTQRYTLLTDAALVAVARAAAA